MIFAGENIIIKMLDGLRNLQNDQPFVPPTSENDPPEDQFIPDSSKKLTISDITQLYASESIKESKEQVIYWMNLRIAILALNGKRDSESIAFLKKALLKYKDSINKSYVEFATQLLDVLDKPDWQQKIKSIDSMPKDDSFISLKSDDKMAKALGVGGVPFWPTVNSINPLMALGYKDLAIKALEEGTRLHKSFPEAITDKEKKNQALRERYLEIYYKTIYESTIPGTFIKDKALQKKSFCVGGANCADKKSIQDFLDEGKIVIVVRGEYYCKPCREELKILDNDRSWEFNDKVVLVIVSEDEANNPKQTLQRDIKEKFYESHPGISPESTLPNTFLTPSVPKMFIIAPNGQLVAILPELQSDKLLPTLKRIMGPLSAGMIELQIKK